MWPQSWRNQFFKLFFALCFIFTLDANGQPKTATPPVPKPLKVKFMGVIESLETLIDIHKEEYNKVQSKIQANPVILSSVTDLKSVKLNSYWIKSLLFYTDEKYLSIAGTQECRFLSLIDSGLVRTAKGKVTTLIVDIEKKNGEKTSALVQKDEYLTFVYKTKCFNNKEISTLFKDENISRTVNTIPFKVPQTKKECLTIYDDWISNPYLPYLCYIPEVVKRGNQAGVRLKNSNITNLKTQRSLQQTSLTSRKMKKKITFFHRSYLGSLCFNISKPEDFCKTYLTNDVWNKVVNGELPDYIMSYKCRNALKKSSLTKADLKACATKFNKDPSYCSTLGVGNADSLFPKSNCEETSEALLNGTLTTKYHDCPSEIDNQGITNVHRIVSHKLSSELVSDKDTCGAQANYTFAKLNLDAGNSDGWPLRICYTDKSTDKKVCAPYVPGYIPDSDLDEGKVIANILYKTKSAPAKLKCLVVDSKTYKPVRLKYRNGCFIVYDASLCTPLFCEKKIIYDKKEMTDIKYQGVPIFDYFATAFSNEKFSANNIMINSFKLKSKRIRNLTQLTNYLNRGDGAIIHGVGCAEDLLPAFFKKESFNECRPIPFIVDGMVNKNKTPYLVLRTSIDDIHSPRLVVWNHIFSAISNYRDLHPLNSWALYGIK